MSKVLRNIIADNIVRLRKRRNMSQVKLAELSNVSISYIKKIELKQQNPSVETLEKIAKALRVDIKELF